MNAQHQNNEQYLKIGVGKKRQRENEHNDSTCPGSEDDCNVKYELLSGQLKRANRRIIN